MVDSELSVPAPRRRGKRVAGLAVFGLAAAWSALWWFASNRAAAAFDAWLQAEAGAGRQWTCPERHIGGYPMALKIRCRRPTFHGEVAGRIATGVTEGFEARFSLLRPTTLVLDMAGPLNLHADDDDFDLMVSWAGLRLTAGGLPQPPKEGTLDATRLAVTLSTQAEGDLNLRAAHLSGRAEPDTGDEAGAGDEAFAFMVSGAAFPTVEAFAGGSDQPMQAGGRGVLTHADLLTAPTLARLEAWRKAQGSLHVEALTLAQGAFTGQASGVIGLDPSHRMAGRLDTSLAGFEPIAQRLGIPIAGVRLGGILSNLLGGKKAPGPTPASADALRLPVTFSNGRLSIGPFATAVRLNPLY